MFSLRRKFYGRQLNSCLITSYKFLLNIDGKLLVIYPCFKLFFGTKRTLNYFYSFLEQEHYSEFAGAFKMTLFLREHNKEELNTILV